MEYPKNISSKMDDLTLDTSSAKAPPHRCRPTKWDLPALPGPSRSPKS